MGDDPERRGGAGVPEREVLQGGVANAGAVLRQGDVVLRPARPNSVSIHALLRHVRAAGFDGVPAPLGLDPDGFETLGYIAGDVPLPPYPAWAQTDVALASIGELLARFHAAAAGFRPPESAAWAPDLADPAGGELICHGDVCLENVVFRDGIAVALLDFDFAAPGRPLYDLSSLARMCVPLDTAEQARRMGWQPADPFRRLRLLADAYGLPPGREGLVDVIDESMRTGAAFVRHRVERGEPAFVDMWRRMGGQARYERRDAWFRANRGRFLTALG